MIKVKSFVPNSLNPLHHERLDDAINHFIQTNNIEVINIKYASSICDDNGRISFSHSALLIYKVN